MGTKVRHEGRLLDKQRVFVALQLKYEDRVLGDSAVRKVAADSDVPATARNGQAEKLPLCR